MIPMVTVHKLKKAYDNGMEQLVDRPEEMSQWLRCLFPDIQPAMYDQDGCWIAFMMTRETEHNPPFAWMARAFDAV